MIRVLRARLHTVKVPAPPPVLVVVYGGAVQALPHHWEVHVAVLGKLPFSLALCAFHVSPAFSLVVYVAALRLVLGKDRLRWGWAHKLLLLCLLGLLYLLAFLCMLHKVMLCLLLLVCYCGYIHGQLVNHLL